MYALPRVEANQIRSVANGTRRRCNRDGLTPGVLILGMLPLAGGLLAGLIALLVLDAMGNTYRSGPHDVREQLRTATLYHYCNVAFVGQFVDTSTGTVTLRRRSRTKKPYLTGRRALYFYVAHLPRGEKDNHPKHWHRAAAVITVHGSDLLAAIVTPTSNTAATTQPSPSSPTITALGRSPFAAATSSSSRTTHPERAPRRTRSPPMRSDQKRTLVRSDSGQTTLEWMAIPGAVIIAAIVVVAIHRDYRR